MAFRAPFSKVFAKPFGGEAVAVPWYLTGGIPAANCLAAFQPKGAASLAASYINLVTPGVGNAAPGTAPLWDAVNGWKFLLASSQYLITSVVLSAGVSVIVRFSNAATGDATMLGSRTSGNNGIYFRPARSAITGARYVNGAALDVLPIAASGVMAISGKNTYRNGVADGTIGAGSNTNTSVAYFGALNTAGVAGNFSTCYIQAAAFYNIATDAYIPGLTVAMNAL